MAGGDATVDAWGREAQAIDEVVELVRKMRRRDLAPPNTLHPLWAEL
jgi:hypothetical protein